MVSKILVSFLRTSEILLDTARNGDYDSVRFFVWRQYLPKESERANKTMK